MLDPFRRRPPPAARSASRWTRAAALALALVLAAASGPGSAADNANDQNTHDAFNGPELPGPDDPGGDPCDQSKQGSPVILHNREFIWDDTDVAIAGRRNLELTRSYRSFDARDGYFGRGWVSECERALVKVIVYPERAGTAAVEPQLRYVYRLANGRRYEFVEEKDGTFVAPDGLQGYVLREVDGAPVLTRLNGASETYNRIGQLTADIDRNGNRIDYRYVDGVLSRIADEHGRFLQLTFDSTGHVTSVSDHTDRTWTYAYDAEGTLASVTDPLGGVRRYEYVPGRREASAQTYPLLARIVDETDRTVIAVTYTETAQVESYTVGENTYTYSERSGFVYKADSVGSRWSYKVDDLGHVVELLPPVNRNTPHVWEYDANGNLTSYQDTAGTAFTSDYDALGRRVAQTSPEGTERFSYVDRTSWVRDVTSVTGRVYRFEYDEDGDPTAMIDPSGGRTAMFWNTQGDLLRITNPLGAVSRQEVDAAGLVTKVTDPLGRESSIAYDRRGNAVAVTDPLRNTTRFDFDALDRVTNVTDALDRTTVMSYDAAGRLLSVTDPAGGRYRFEYDTHGRLTSESRPDGTRYAFTYGPDNLPLTSTDPNGVVSTFSYDRNKNVTAVATGSERRAYGYDVLDRLVSTQSNAASASYTYDTLSRLVGESQGGFEVSYTFNAEGEMTGATYGGQSMAYEYNDRGELSGVATPLGRYRYARDALGRLTSVTLPDGRERRYGYDAANQLIGIDSSETAASSVRYEYDAGGRIGEIYSDDVLRWRYGYDAVNRLIEARGAVGNYAYAYDVNGNRTDRRGRYDTFNRLLEDEAYTYAYDASGSLVSRVDKNSGAELRLVHSSFNRLTRLEEAPAAGAPASRTVTYRYDAQGRRVEKRVGREPAVRFGWIGDHLAAELDGRSVVAHYRYDGGFAAMEIGAGDQTFLVESDYLGTPLHVYRADGSGGGTRRLGPYAERPATSGLPADFPPVASRQGLPGQYLDAESGLFYNLFRYYDADTGRYLRADPLGLYSGINAYAYAGSNPVNNIDPSGQIINFIIGSGGSVISGYAISLITGCKYGWGDALTDAALGAAGVGLANKLQKLNRIRKLRRLARNRGLTHQGKSGYTEKWRSATERLNIKHEAGKSPNLQAGSKRPRFDWRTRAGTNQQPAEYWDPFTNQVGPKGNLSHVPLQPGFSPGAAAGIGVGAGAAAAGARGRDCDC